MTKHSDIDEWADKVNMTGRSPTFLKTLALIRKVSAWDVPVIIEGETGTGKELAARAIHCLGSRSACPFVPVNCGAIPDTLIENELFGHRKGAFTDAKGSQPGLVSQAKGGTLFLDEIDALTPKGQVTVLRFLQTQHFRPLGSSFEEHANVRVVAATNADLCKLVECGAFRPDLLFRLKVLTIPIPPLRDRSEDIEPLCRRFISTYSRVYGIPEKSLHHDSLSWLTRYHWPGNVRELENLIHREFLLADGQMIHLKQDCAPVERRKLLDRRGRTFPDLHFKTAKTQVLMEFERQFLYHLMVQTQGNVSLAAKQAGKERRALGKLLKKYGIERQAFQNSH